MRGMFIRAESFNQPLNAPWYHHDRLDPPGGHVHGRERVQGARAELGVAERPRDELPGPGAARGA